MRTDVLLTILGMAAVTYATRAGGFWLMGRVTPAPVLAAWLRHIPGAVLVAIVAPTVLSGGPAGALAAIATVLIAARTGNVLLAMVGGVAAVVGVRAVL